jgi:hypothetical protein
MKTSKRTGIRPDSGSVLVLSLLLLLALGGLTATLSVLNLRLHAEHEHAREDLRAFCAAEAGLNEAYAVLQKSSVAGVRAIDYPCVTSSGSYQVELLDGRDDAAIDLDRIRLRSVGAASREPVGVQLMVDHVPTGKFRFAIFGAEGVLLNSNVTVDSYDPDDGPYPDKVEYVNGYGNVGSYKKIAIHSNVSVHGDALVATDGVYDDDAPGILVTGDQEAGKLNEDMPVIAVPSFPTNGTLLVSAAKTLPPGNYHYSSLTVGGSTLTVQGPATLVLDQFVMTSKSKLVVDTTNGPVQLYATGNVKLDSNSRIKTTSERASDFEVLITSDNVTGGKIVDLSSNTEFMGTIYAPNARLKIPSNFKVFGALKATFVELASNSQIHFDEGLLYDPNAADIFEVVSWRRLSQEEIRAVELGGALP